MKFTITKKQLRDLILESFSDTIELEGIPVKEECKCPKDADCVGWHTNKCLLSFKKRECKICRQTPCVNFYKGCGEYSTLQPKPPADKDHCFEKTCLCNCHSKPDRKKIEEYNKIIKMWDKVARKVLKGDYYDLQMGVTPSKPDKIEEIETELSKDTANDIDQLNRKVNELIKAHNET